MKTFKIWCGSLDTLMSKTSKMLSEHLFNAGFTLCDSIKKANYRVLLIKEIELYYNEIKKILNQNPNNPLLIVVKNKQILTENYWRLIEIGCVDVIDADMADINIVIQSKIQRWCEISNILFSPIITHNMVGKSTTWLNCLREAIEAAYFSSTPILILGESGTGKEMMARLIHSIDTTRKNKKLVVLDCTTITSGLSGSEFFGHEKGAFTSAHSGRDGAFSLAHEGSLFLDEIGELPMSLQSQLLRVIQEKSYKRVGGNVWYDSNFRLICATNRNLLSEIKSGNFREDLYYRIACKIIHLPPLNARDEDIIDLTKCFLSEWFDPVPEISEPVKQYLQTRDYPGNIRQLRQLISRISLSYTGFGPITIGHIPKEDRPISSDIDNQVTIQKSMRECINKYISMGKGLKSIGKISEEFAIELALLKCNGNTPKAAKILQVSNRTLQLRKSDIPKALS